jgi:opacity protein-like surface antigen
MKRLLSGAFAASMALACTAPASAQVVLEANGARAEGEWGGEVGIGYSIALLPGLAITPAVGALIYAGGNDRYYLDENGGNERCRDSTNGQYASDSECNNTAVKPYGRLEATYSVPLVATIGAGVRFGGDVLPYGTVGLPIGPKISLKGNAGPKYFALGLRAGL